MSAFSSFESLFGPTLNTKNGEETTSNLLDGKSVMVYFSAHWCPPCKAFTPKLSEFYTNLKKTNPNFECVFVSSDRDEAAFKEYYNEMSFLSLPFSARDIKAKLSKKYKVSGIPSLIVLGSDGEVITTDGRSKVDEDPKGENFPWVPKPFAEILPDKLTSKDGEEAVDTKSLDDKILMLYFSAHWCPPCRGYTPELVKVYNQLKKDNKDVELVFVSSDRDESSFKEYYAEMPWLALPFSNRGAKVELSSLFEIEGIPSLVVLNKVNADGKRDVITSSGRPTLATVEEFPWYPKPFGNISESVECNGADINEAAALIVLCEGADDDEQKDIKDLIAKISQSKKDEEPKTLFFYGDSSKGAVGRIRQLCKLKNDGEIVMIKLDIPDNGGYYVADKGTDITEDSILAFLEDLGERKQLS